MVPTSTMHTTRNPMATQHSVHWVFLAGGFLRVLVCAGRGLGARALVTTCLCGESMVTVASWVEICDSLHDSLVTAYLHGVAEVGGDVHQ